ncbi:MAG: LysM peptidoglycan-binding domain-containing protein [Thermoflexales bacterium]|nr:LysM peptidoglycan-binding domain-containing protein [Thermoflexales bacterium]
MSRNVKQVKARKRCPSCGAFNQNEAVVCEMCGYLFTDAPQAARNKATPSPPPPSVDEATEESNISPQPPGTALPGRPPSLAYWRPKSKPTDRLKRRIGAVVSATALIVAALIGIWLIVSGLNRVRENPVAAPPTSTQPRLATPMETSAPEQVLPSSVSEATASPTATPTLPPAPVPSPSPTPTRPPRQTYIVQAGDSCSAIASRFGVTVSDLIVWNNLPDNCLIRLGQELFVSPP